MTFTLPPGGATPATPASQNLAFTTIPISSSAPTTPLATAGQPLSGISSTLVADSAPRPTFQLANIVGTNNGATGSFTAEFQVKTDATRLVRPLHSATTQITLQTTGTAAGPQTITSCSGTQPANQKTAYVVDEKPAGTNEGPCDVGVWLRRDLNAIKFDSGIGVAVAGNAITLPAGTFRIRAQAPASVAGNHKIRIRNITDNVILGYGTTQQTSNAYAHMTSSEALVRFTIPAAKQFVVEHVCGARWNDTIEFGMALSGGAPGQIPGEASPEIFTTVEINQE